VAALSLQEDAECTDHIFLGGNPDTAKGFMAFLLHVERRTSEAVG
jgi:hypothetical protein